MIAPIDDDGVRYRGDKATYVNGVLIHDAKLYSLIEEIRLIVVEQPERLVRDTSLSSIINRLYSRTFDSQTGMYILDGIPGDRIIVNIRMPYRRFFKKHVQISFHSPEVKRLLEDWRSKGQSEKSQQGEKQIQEVVDHLRSFRRE